MKHVRSAKILLFNEKDEVLILRRSHTHPWAALKPDLPGGMIEKDESFQEGIIREVVEETGIKLQPDQLIDVYSANEKIMGVLAERKIYVTHLNETPKVLISWEHDQYRWISIHDIEDIEPSNQVGIDEIIKHKTWQRVVLD